MDANISTINQYSISAYNFIVVFILAGFGSQHEFISFSNALAAVSLSYAISEAGISYIAPKTIIENKSQSSKWITSFLAISLSLFTTSTVVVYFIWRFVTNDGLSLSWYIFYVIHFIPVLLMPNWVTFLSINRSFLLSQICTKLIVTIFLFQHPTLHTFAIVSILVLLFTMAWLYQLNIRKKMFCRLDIKFVLISFRLIKNVFAPKTMAYSLYCLTPLIVGVNFGATGTADYVKGERLKSALVTLFLPILHILHLKVAHEKKRMHQIFKHFFSFFLSVIAISSFSIALIYISGMEIIPKALTSVPDLYTFIIAAIASVLSSMLLQLIIFPNGQYRSFKLATYFQSSCFLLLFFLSIKLDFISGGKLLLCCELIFLFSLLGLTIKLKE